MRLPASKLIRLLIALGGVFMLCICSFLGYVFFSGTNENAAVTATARAQVAMLKLTPLETETPPSATSAPTNTPAPTATARPTLTRAPAWTVEPTATSVPTPTPAPTNTPAPGDGLRRAAVSLHNPNTDLTADVGTVSFDGFTWDEGTLVSGAAYDFQRVAPLAFAAEPTMDTLLFQAFAPFKDAYGNTEHALAVEFRITRAVAQKINWSGLAAQRIGVLLAGEPGCAVDVHPALAGAYAKWVTGE